MKRIFSFTGKRAKERLGLTQDLMEIALGEMYYLNHDSRCIKCWSDKRGRTTDLHEHVFVAKMLMCVLEY